MSVAVWIVLFVFSLLLCGGSVALLIVRKYLLNKYYHAEKKDELINKTKTTNSRNFLYFTNGNTLNYISKYVLCKSMYDRYVIAQYLKKYEYIMFYIICYNKNGKVVSVKKYEELDTALSSKIIALDKKTDHLNIIIGKVNEVMINGNVIRGHSSKKIMIYSLLIGLAFLSGTFALRQIIAFFVGASRLYFYLNSGYNVVSILISLGAGIFTFLFAYVFTRKKNIRSMSGGVVEYEFI